MGEKIKYLHYVGVMKLHIIFLKLIKETTPPPLWIRTFATLHNAHVYVTDLFTHQLICLIKPISIFLRIMIDYNELAGIFALK